MAIFHGYVKLPEGTQVSADHRVDGRRGWASTIAGPLDGARASEISDGKIVRTLMTLMGTNISY